MEWKIIDKTSKALSINDLDRDAYEFWGKEYEEEYYANPYELKKIPEGASDEIKRRIMLDNTRTKLISNWYDTLGSHICYPKANWTKGFDNIKASMCSMSFCHIYNTIDDKEKWDESCEITRQYLKDYFDLWDHWKSKGYEPVKVD